jgi:DNA-binding transcriptional ArsR family regulator
MVTMQPPTSEADAPVFGAISHPARRRILDLLSEGEQPVHTIASGVAREFAMSRPAVSQHLRVLLDAGLVTEQRRGRERRYQLVPGPLTTVRDWLAHYERFWDQRLERLRDHLASTHPVPGTPADKETP